MRYRVNWAYASSLAGPWHEGQLVELAEDVAVAVDPPGGQTWSATEDAIHDAVLDAMSRAIDDVCGQFLYQTLAQARVFTACWADVLVVPPPGIRDESEDRRGRGRDLRADVGGDRLRALAGERPHWPIRPDPPPASSFVPNP